VYDVTIDWIKDVESGKVPAPYLIIDTPLGYRVYGLKDVSNLDALGTDYFDFKGRIISLSGLTRSIQPSTSTIIGSYSQKQLQVLTVVLDDADSYFRKLFQIDPFLGQSATLYTGFLDDATTDHIALFSGQITKVEGNDKEVRLSIEEKSSVFDNLFSLKRAGRFDNPLNTNDRLPIVYGDMTTGSEGVWKANYIDTVNFVYCYAGHEVLSNGNGNDITVYVDGVEDWPKFDESNSSYEDMATIDFGFYGDLFSEDCSAFGSWADHDSGDGVSTQVTFDGKSCFRFDGGSVTSANKAERQLISSLTLENRFSIEIKIYFDLLGTYANYDYFMFHFRLGESREYLSVFFATDGVYISPVWDTGSIGNFVVLDTWQTWKFIVTDQNPLTVDIYLDDILIVRGYSISAISGVSQKFILLQRGDATANTKTYLDYIKIDNGARCNKGNSIVTVKGKGKASGSTLIENIIDILYDFLVVEAEMPSALFNTSGKAKAIANFDSQSYVAAGVIDSDENLWNIVSKMMGSFLGSVYFDGDGDLIVDIDIGYEYFPHAVINKGDIDLSSLKWKLNRDDLINQIPVSYSYNYAQNEFESHGPGTSSIDAASQGIFGERMPTTPLKFYWCRDSTSVGNIMNLLVAKLKTPTYQVSFRNVTAKCYHIDVGDYLAVTLPLYDEESGEEWINQIVKVVRTSPDFAKGTVDFTVVDTQTFMTWAELAQGTYRESSFLGTPGTPLLADGSVKAGGNRDLTVY